MVLSITDSAHFAIRRTQFLSENVKLVAEQTPLGSVLASRSHRRFTLWFGVTSCLDRMYLFSSLQDCVELSISKLTRLQHLYSSVECKILLSKQSGTRFIILTPEDDPVPKHIAQEVAIVTGICKFSEPCYICLNWFIFALRACAKFVSFKNNIGLRREMCSCLGKNCYCALHFIIS